MDLFDDEEKKKKHVEYVVDLYVQIQKLKEENETLRQENRELKEEKNKYRIPVLGTVR